MMFSRSLPYAAALVGLAAFGSAAAQTAEPAKNEAVSSKPGFGKALDASELDALEGGQQVVTTTNQNVTAVSSGNRISADTVGSGSITVGQNALAGFSGVGNFVMNTGHNNNLQGTLSVTVVMPPAPQ